MLLISTPRRRAPCAEQCAHAHTVQGNGGAQHTNVFADETSAKSAPRSFTEPVRTVHKVQK